MAAIRSILSIAVILISTLLYYRARPLSLLYTNALSRLPSINNLKGFDIKFADELRNCEDAVLDTEAGFALLSCDPGRDHWNTVMGTFTNSAAPSDTGIHLWHYADPASKPEKLVRKHGETPQPPFDFHPLGIEYQPATQELMVIKHGAYDSQIESYKLSIENVSATFQLVFQHPLLPNPNSIAALSTTEYLITNDHYFRRRDGSLLPLLETYLGIPGGSIVYFAYDPDLPDGEKVTVKTLARLPFANGIAMLNASTVAVASSSDASVTLYTIKRLEGEKTPKLSVYRTINVSFHPDNLSVDGDGKLLITGHPHAPSLEKLAKNNGRCHSVQNKTKANCDIRAPSWIVEWSEGDGLQTLYTGIKYGSSTTAMRDVQRRLGLAVGLYAKGVLTWTL